MATIVDDDDFGDEFHSGSSRVKSGGSALGAQQVTGGVACTVCFEASPDIQQCKRCYVKVCAGCRDGIAGPGRSSEQAWICSSCASGGVGIETLMTAPTKRTSKVVKQGKTGTKKRYTKRRRTSK